MAETTIRRLFFDIETSPCLGWFWRPSFKMSLNYDNVIEDAKIICICYKWNNQDTIYHLNWDKKQSDEAMIKKFISIMNKADEIIGHNSDKFDTKWIRTRAAYYDIDMMPDFKSIDTLKQSRTLFNAPSNRLDSLGKYHNLGQKLENEKGLWQKVWRENNRAALKRMVAYCKQDVILLEQYFNKINKYMKPKTHANGSSIMRLKGLKRECPECGSQDNSKVTTTRYSATGLAKVSLQCKSCQKYYTVTLPKKK